MISTHVTAGRQAEEWCGKTDFKISWIFKNCFRTADPYVSVLEMRRVQHRDENLTWCFTGQRQFLGLRQGHPPRLPWLWVLTWSAGWWKALPPLSSLAPSCGTRILQGVAVFYIFNSFCCYFSCNFYSGYFLPFCPLRFACLNVILLHLDFKFYLLLWEIPYSNFIIGLMRK